ncbi:dihydrofolate reductase family protein [Gordonia phthalatica]|uniref:Deaminase n=1 Tax=Gordonia phthalatica TaxID=1136941 RepID=A0A0N9N4S9_9ACTN|nr:dihydrofolate reductase family protein [Gordonia phthalatica]ALG85445.1 deaminase [Gordonia phthalatica]
MGSLSYTATISLDGYAVDADGDFQWGAPTPEIFQVHLDRMHEVSTEVLGRNTYLLMKYWEAEPDDEEWADAEREFSRRWQALELIVASSTLTHDDLGSGTARLISDLTLPALEQIVADAAGEVEIFGPTTAAPAIVAGMVRDFRFFVVPKVVGGGVRALPDGARLDLKLVESTTYDNGFAYLHYRRG